MKKILKIIILLSFSLCFSFFLLYLTMIYNSVINPPAIFNGWFKLYSYTLKKNILTQNSHINFSNYYDDYDWDKIIFRERSPQNEGCQEIILLKNEKEVMKEYSACQDFDGIPKYHFLFTFKNEEYQRVYLRKEVIIPIHKDGLSFTADLTKGGIGSKWGSRY